MIAFIPKIVSLLNGKYIWVLITMAVFLMKLAVNNLAVFLINGSKLMKSAVK